MELGQSDMMEHAVHSEVCLVCEEISSSMPQLFDCGHSVCFDCTTGMLLANYKNAIFAMPCPCSVAGCTGKFAFLQTADVHASLPDASATEEANEEWRRYLPSVANAMLRIAGIYPCPSAACAKNDRVLFIPSAAGLSQDSQDTECGSCGLHICTRCTHDAGKCVPFHGPMPCVRRVDLEDRVSTLHDELHQVEEEERNAARVAREVSISVMIFIQNINIRIGMYLYRRC